MAGFLFFYVQWTADTYGKQGATYYQNGAAQRFQYPISFTARPVNMSISAAGSNPLVCSIWPQEAYTLGWFRGVNKTDSNNVFWMLMIGK